MASPKLEAMAERAATIALGVTHEGESGNTALAWLERLWRKLDGEGRYTDANTVALAISALGAPSDLLASCEEFLPILERQLESVNPGGIINDSKAYQFALARVERMRAAIAKAEGGVL